MSFGTRLQVLRHSNGITQEQFAQQLNVSRQAVSKWEMAQSIPDLDKILQMSSLFGVSTDFLLKDELEEEKFVESTETCPPLRKVSLTEAKEYLAQRRSASVGIAVATFLCILSPAPLLLLGSWATSPHSGISKTFAGAVGLVVLLLLVAVAVAIYIFIGSRNAPYEFLEKEPFETEYGVTGIVRQQQSDYRNTYTTYNILGTVLCILSPIPLFLGAFSENVFLLGATLALLLLTVGIGVIFFLLAGVRWASMQKLLQEGEFQPSFKNRLAKNLDEIYWPLALGIYLLWSFVSGKWHITWVVWPAAAILYTVVEALIASFSASKK